MPYLLAVLAIFEGIDHHVDPVLHVRIVIISGCIGDVSYRVSASSFEIPIIRFIPFVDLRAITDEISFRKIDF